MLKIIYLSLFVFTINNVFAQKCLSGNCVDGNGVWQFESGSKLQATFKNGDFSKGILSTSKGDVYEGEFKNEQYNGTGYLTNKNGDFEIGIFKKDTLYSGYQYKNKVIIHIVPKLKSTDAIKIGQAVSQIKKEEKVNPNPGEKLDSPENLKPKPKIVESFRIMNTSPTDKSYTHFIYTGNLMNDLPEDQNASAIYFFEINELYSYKGDYKMGKREGKAEIINSKFTQKESKQNKQKVVQKYTALFENDVEQK